MGNTNTLPVVSQVKSAVLAVTGDFEGAIKVQSDFVHECPVVSQLTSAVYYATGNHAEAWFTQIRSAKAVYAGLDGIPVLGHVKGGIHYAFGDTEGGNRAMMSASRTAAVIGGGIGGSLVGGPMGAIGGGIAAGGAVDKAFTVIDSAVHKEYRPHGILALVNEAMENPTAENIFDAAASIFMDGACGAASPAMVEFGPTKLTKTQWRRVLRKNAKARATGAPMPVLPKGSPSVGGITVDFGEYGTTKMTRTEWRRILRKNAKARLNGGPMQHMPSAHVSPFAFGNNGKDLPAVCKMETYEMFVSGIMQQQCLHCHQPNGIN